MKYSFLILASCINGLQAHMQLANPYPIRSPFDTSNPSPYNDYMTPLKRDATDYPCKGLVIYALNHSLTPTTQYQAGNEYTASLAGGASHGGGSCQFSLSYDGGKTFKVIKSVVGSCPTKLNYQFKIPTDAPVGRALFAWTWFNRLGHREMYMNCASVNISAPASTPAASDDGTETGPGTAVPSRRLHFDKVTEVWDLRPHKPSKREETPNTSFVDLPVIFVANVYSAPWQCETVEGTDVVFYDLGPQVEYGDGYEYTGDPGYICRKSSPTFAHDGASPAPSPTRSTETTAAAPKQNVTSSTTPAPQDNQRHPATTLSTLYHTTAKRPSTSKSKEPAIPPLATDDPCAPGSIRCDSLHTYSLCSVRGVYVSMGEVMDSERCEDGKILFGKAG